MPLFSIKMRACRKAQGREEHISGAERIAPAEAMPGLAQAFVARAQHHGKGRPEYINIKVEAVPESACLRLPSLPVRALDCADAAEGLRLAADLLARAGVPAPQAVIALLRKAGTLRGAMLLDADSLERLEPDKLRGIRATYMDAAAPAPTSACSGVPEKNHYQEAVVLAAKVAHAPNILAEICISDDPDYVTGYVASRELGYVRIARMKEPGSPQGGRIFLYRGQREDLAATIDFIERRPVLVENIPDAPGFGANPPVAPRSAAPDLPGTLSGGMGGTATRAGKWGFLDKRLEGLHTQSLRRRIREMASPPGPIVRCEGRDLLLLASNDYLGLADDPRVKACAAGALAAYGAGSGGSRLTTGSLELHGELERRLAAFKHAEAALLFNTGYMANVGVISALCDKDWVIFSDELNHASIIDGCRLSRAQIVVYRHNDTNDLEARARCHAGRPGLIVSDAVFSMDGDVASLPELLRIANRFGFFSMIDEAHATGVLGATGRGAAEHFGLLGAPEGTPDITVGTLSKALGSEGGYVCGSARLIEYLKNSARSFIFSTALSPAPVAAALKALEILSHEPERVRCLRENTAFFRGRLQELGIAAYSDSAIVPLRVGDEKAALNAAQHLFNAGYCLSAVRYPSVPRGSARLRATLRSDHNEAQLADAARQVALALKHA